MVKQEPNTAESISKAWKMLPFKKPTMSTQVICARAFSLIFNPNPDGWRHICPHKLGTGVTKSPEVIIFVHLILIQLLRIISFHTILYKNDSFSNFLINCNSLFLVVVLLITHSFMSKLPPWAPSKNFLLGTPSPLSFVVYRAKGSLVLSKWRSEPPTTTSAKWITSLFPGCHMCPQLPLCTFI